MSSPFILVSPATRGLSLALTRHVLRTTDLPIYATHRSEKAEEMKKHILAPLGEIDGDRLRLIPLNLASEGSIASASQSLADALPQGNQSYLHMGFFTGGILHPERQPADLDAAELQHTFQINVISHLLMIKHFSRFLPTAKQGAALTTPCKWVHVSARVGSITDNKNGGWYSYRASKAALNQVIKTFDLQLQMKKTPEDKLFDPEYAAKCLVDVVDGLSAEHRGRVWDWAGKEVPA
ncbi:hypothetical protein HYDPIDRAFT_105319 [Hydnomerulius pinastri MD-312]|nr:hypothetical protein HYDPIDRAFT_105319 [Hydnomerulius pinastri MD-312]